MSHHSFLGIARPARRKTKMTSRDFCYWLQGYFEIRGGNCGLTAAQCETIERHLALVFKHEIDPAAGDAKAQAALNAIHSGGVGGVQIRC
jgi:hypothetical protein